MTKYEVISGPNKGSEKTPHLDNFHTVYTVFFCLFFCFFCSKVLYLPEIACPIILYLPFFYNPDMMIRFRFKIFVVTSFRGN